MTELNHPVWGLQMYAALYLQYKIKNAISKS